MKTTQPIFILIGLIFAQVHAVTLNRGNGAEPDSLNIHLAQGINSHNILLDMYEGLMTFDAQGKVVYGVAEHHEVSEDNRQWTFYLNSLAKWSDGSPLLASDFIHAWEIAISDKTAAPYRHLFDNLMSNEQLNVKATQPHQLNITLQHADPSLLQKLVLPIFYPLPAHSNELSVTNGAYSLSQWNIQEFISLTKNPYFHSAKEVNIDKVIYWVTENQNSELLRFRAKELDITETIPDHQITWLKQHLANELRIAPYYGTFFLGLNLQDPHLNHHTLRQALSHAIDRQILVDKVLKSGQKIAVNIIPPDSPNEVDPLFDISLAQKLLKQSPFKPETDRLEILYNNSDNQKKVALAVAAMWRQNLGVKTTLKNQEWKMFVVTRKGSNKQVFRSGWIADYFDPLNFLELFHSQSRFNFYGFNDSSYDDWIQKLNTSNQPERIQTAIHQAETILAEQLPVIPLYHYVSRHLVSLSVTGYQDNLMDKHLSRYLHKIDSN